MVVQPIDPGRSHLCAVEIVARLAPCRKGPVSIEPDGVCAPNRVISLPPDPSWTVCLATEAKATSSRLIAEVDVRIARKVAGGKRMIALPWRFDYPRSVGSSLASLLEPESRFVLNDFEGEHRAAALFARASAVAAGLGGTDRVATYIRTPNRFVSAVFGTLVGGGTVVPIDHRLHPREVERIVRLAGAGRLLGDEDVVGSGPRSLNAVEGGPALVLYTSGSTAQPKGVVLSHAAILENARAWNRRYSIGSDDIVLTTLGLAHSFGFTTVLTSALLAGAKVIIPEDPLPARVAELAHKHRPTLFVAAASYYRYLADSNQAHAFTTVRRFLAGACTLPADVDARFRERFGQEILQTYGLTEAGPVVTANPPDRNRRGSVGVPLEGIDVRLRGEEPGELLVRSASLMDGYLGAPDATNEVFDGGWLATGDVASIDRHGYVTILGRIKDLIVRAGMKIFPEEVEEVIREHPAVSDVAVVGAPDPRYEEVPVAFIVPSAERFDPAELRSFLEDRIAAFKVPRRFEIIDAIPRNPNGKMLRPVLRKRLEGGP